MSNRVELERLKPDDISANLTDADISLWEFCGLFNLNYDTAKRWLLPVDHKRAMDPPYWVGPVLAMLATRHYGEAFLDIARHMRAKAGAPIPADAPPLARKP